MHYASNFNKAMSKGFSIAHICPAYHLESLDKEMLRQMIKKTLEKVEFILLDWKGLKKEKRRIKILAEETGLQIMKI